MSTNRGIFESFPNQPGARQDSPFAVVHEPAAEPASSPFAAVTRQDSPFTVVDENSDSRPVEPGKPARLPERRKQDSPFQVAEPTEGFGFEAAPRAFGASPFEVAPAPAPTAPAPFSAPAQPAASPFAIAAEPQHGPSQTTQAAIAAFSNWQESQPAPAPAAPVSQVFEQATPPPFTPATQVPSAFSAAPQQAAPAPAPAVPVDGSQSDSFAIRQLELRAIFGVDREMTPDEILQRSRALPGMRNIARVAPQDMATIEALKSLLPNLGFGSGGLKLYAGSVPLEFIREGSVLLAVQTDGGFAPGVRETLMIVARELGRLS
ncbi:MAG: hypothetical protein ABIT37_23115 [Luteolibacter sp.]